VNMPTRRRFFPMQPVQTVPGQTVELSVMLHPQGQAAAPAPGPAPGPGPGPGPGCDILGVSWVGNVMDQIAREQGQPFGADISVEALGGDRWRYAYEYGGLREAVFSGVPARVDPAGQPLALPASGWGCHELMVTGDFNALHLTGILYGRSMSDVQWALSWDQPWDDAFQYADPAADPSADPDGVYSLSGHMVRRVGNVIIVELARVFLGSIDLLETLTASASCAGSPVGTLVLNVRRLAY